MAEDERTRRWQRISSPVIRPETDGGDPIRALRAAISAVRKAPRDEEARRTLRAIAAEQGAWDQLALLLTDEARAGVERPEVAAALYEELADVHENLDQPIETITAMEAVVALQPNEVQHHDRLAWLYRRAGATVKAAAAFEQVARLARDDRGRAALRAAGKLYRDAGRLDKAAEVYRAVVERRASDLEAWRALEEILGELGRWREVAEVRGVLAERASGVDKAVLLRSQARAFEQAGDIGTASELVATAAQHAPDDVSGLVDYATMLLREGRPREAADVLAQRIRESISDGAPSANIAALRLRYVEALEACDDPAALDVLDQLLAASPDYVAARTKLVEMGRRRRDLSILERAIELGADDEELNAEVMALRTAAAVDHAVAEAIAGDSASAERTLRGILAEQPLHEAANIALADLLSASGRAHAAAAHLRGTLSDAPDGTPPELIAKLVHRCAKVMAALGQADEAHQLLHEAHHLSRRDLLITLSLGESCFSRKLWREAAIHLGSLAEHPDASKYATQVALGLVRAGQAEVRALKPINANKHYEAAVRVDPRCAAAWHQLAELAMVGGDVARAAECLEQEAAATVEPATRVRLYDALGDLALGILGDPARAERCWANVATSGNADVLDKLLSVQRKRGATVERGDTCERLAALRPDAAKELTLEAAEAFLAGGDRQRARAVIDHLAGQHPLDIDVIACAARIAEGDHIVVAAWLRRALGARDAAGDRGDGDPRRADLWRRLGDAEKARGNERPALDAYQRAVVCDPDSDGALAARRGLITLAASFGRRADTSRLALVEAEQDPDDIIASARELATKPDAAGDARALYELARALGVELVAEDEQFLDANPLRAMASDEAYAAALDDTERRALIDDDADGPLGELLSIVGEAMQLVCPDAKTALEDEALFDAKRIAATNEAATVAIYPQIAKALGGTATLLYASPDRNAPDLRLVLAAPPVIILGPRLAQIRARSRSDSELDVDIELRFRLGRLVELTRPHRLLATGTDRERFERFIAGLVRAFGKQDGDSKPSLAVALEADRLHKALPITLRRRLTDKLATLSPSQLDARAYLVACERAADRAGLVACGHPGYAIHLAGGPKRAQHLVELAASQRYLASQRKLRRR